MKNKNSEWVEEFNKDAVKGKGINPYQEGDLVTVYPLSKDSPEVGTYLGALIDKKIQVLLQSGHIYTGDLYSIGKNL